MSGQGDAQALAENVIHGMLARDEFSRWLGIDVFEIAPGRSGCRLAVRPEMVNGFGAAHGGIAYSLADSALAFACNTNGRVTVAIENSIGYPVAIAVGDVLTAIAVEESTTARLGYYAVTVRNQHGTTVAIFRGTVYRTKKDHIIT